MGKKEDMMAALECKQPEGSVPFWELHFHCWGEAVSKKFVGRPEFDELSVAEQEKAIAANADIIIEVCEKFNFAAATIPDSPWDCFYTLPQDARLKLARFLKDRCEDKFMVMACSHGYIGIPDSEHYVEFSMKLVDSPEEIDGLAEGCLHTGIEAAKELRDAGVEALYCGADLADNRGPYYSPKRMERFVLPYMTKWAEQVHKMGMYAICHSDGNIEPLLAQLVETGIDAVQAIDPVAGMDILKTKQDVDGKLCLCGNLDLGLLQLGTPEDIYASASKIISDCKPGGAFVFGSSNAVEKETPMENYSQLIRAMEDHAAIRMFRS